MYTLCAKQGHREYWESSYGDYPWRVYRLWEKHAICDVRLTMICWNSCTCYSSKDKGKLTSTWIIWKGFKEWFEKSALRRKWTEHSRKGKKFCPETGKLSVDLKTQKGIRWGDRTDRNREMEKEGGSCVMTMDGHCQPSEFITGQL